jgi:hypothetical protein
MERKDFIQMLMLLGAGVGLTIVVLLFYALAKLA